MSDMNADKRSADARSSDSSHHSSSSNRSNQSNHSSNHHSSHQTTSSSDASKSHPPYESKASLSSIPEASSNKPTSLPRPPFSHSHHQSNQSNHPPLPPPRPPQPSSHATSAVTAATLETKPASVITAAQLERPSERPSDRTSERPSERPSERHGASHSNKHSTERHNSPVIAPMSSSSRPAQSPPPSKQTKSPPPISASNLPPPASTHSAPPPRSPLISQPKPPSAHSTHHALSSSVAMSPPTPTKSTITAAPVSAPSRSPLTVPRPPPVKTSPQPPPSRTPHSPPPLPQSTPTSSAPVPTHPSEANIKAAIAARSTGHTDAYGNTTRCVCHDNDNSDGFMLSCDTCEVWQHGDCLGVTEKSVPEQYFCEICMPEHPIHIANDSVKKSNINRRALKAAKASKAVKPVGTPVAAVASPNPADVKKPTDRRKSTNEPPKNASRSDLSKSAPVSQNVVVNKKKRAKVSEDQSGHSKGGDNPPSAKRVKVSEPSTPSDSRADDDSAMGGEADAREERKLKKVLETIKKMESREAAKKRKKGDNADTDANPESSAAAGHDDNDDKDGDNPSSSPTSPALNSSSARSVRAKARAQAQREDYDDFDINDSIPLSKSDVRRKKKNFIQSDESSDDDLTSFTHRRTRWLERRTETHSLGPFYFGRKAFLLQEWRADREREATGWEMSLRDESQPIVKRAVDNFKFTQSHRPWMKKQSNVDGIPTITHSIAVISTRNPPPAPRQAPVQATTNDDMEVDQPHEKGSKDSSASTSVVPSPSGASSSQNNPARNNNPTPPVKPPASSPPVPTRIPKSIPRKDSHKHHIYKQVGEHHPTTNVSNAHSTHA